MPCLSWPLFSPLLASNSKVIPSYLQGLERPKNGLFLAFSLSLQEARPRLLFSPYKDREGLAFRLPIKIGNSFRLALGGSLLGSRLPLGSLLASVAFRPSSVAFGSLSYKDRDGLRLARLARLGNELIILCPLSFSRLGTSKALALARLQRPEFGTASGLPY